MAAGSYTIKAEQGATFSLNLAYQNEDNTPIDLTGAHARCQVRVDPADDDPVLSVEDGNGITLGGEDGTIALEISAEAMSDVPAPGSYRYDLEIEWPGGRVTRVIEGPFVVKPEVSRP